MKNTRSNKGFHLIFMAAMMPAMAWLAGGIFFSRSQASLHEVSVVGNSLLARDLVASILAESSHEFMRQVNDPSHPLFEQVRRAPVTPPREFLPILDHSNRLLSEQTDFRLESATVRVLPPPQDPGPTRPYWRGVVRTEVRLRGVRRIKNVWTGTQDREILIDGVGLPAEFSTPGHIDVVSGAGVPAGIPVEPVQIPLQPWLDRASLRVEADGTGAVQARYEFLQERLGAVNGVVVVGDESSGELALRSVRHRGKAVLVVPGALTLADVRLEDPAQDSLTIIALGPVHLEGTIEARILIADVSGGNGGPGRGRIARTIAADTKITGSLYVASGRVDYGRGFAVEAPGIIQGGRAPVYVSVSPVLLDTRVEVLP